MLTGTPSQHVPAHKQKGMREGGAPGQWDVPTCHSCYGQALEQKDPASSTLLCPVSFATTNKKDFGIALFLPHDLGPSLQCQSGEAHSCPSHRRLRECLERGLGRRPLPHKCVCFLVLFGKGP